MSRTEYFEGAPLMVGERREWSPTAKLILAFILGLLVLSPAILGSYWEMILPR